MYRKNEIIELDITSLTSDGDGVGRAGELVFFVPNTAVGDTIRAKVLKVKKNVGFARVEEIVTPSPDRIEADCPVSFSCGGCVYRHISYEAECRAKRQKVIDAVTRIGKLDGELVRDIIPSKNIDGYRNKAMIPVGRNRDGEVVKMSKRTGQSAIVTTSCTVCAVSFRRRSSTISSRMCTRSCAIVPRWYTRRRIAAASVISTCVMPKRQAM